MVVNALDNVKARNHVNRLCLSGDVPLVESGTAGYLGESSLFVYTILDVPDRLNTLCGVMIERQYGLMTTEERLCSWAIHFLCTSTDQALVVAKLLWVLRFGWSPP